MPQLQDWVRVWRWAREGDSWASAERHSETDNWCDKLKCQHVVKRRAIRNMALVMREVIRAKKREQVKASTCISLSFDDRKAYKLIKFNCDVPLCHHGAPWVSGVIGCVDTLHGDSMESLDMDYAEQTCAKIMDLIEKFATPFGQESRDEAVYNKFRAATRSIWARARSAAALVRFASALGWRRRWLRLLACSAARAWAESVTSPADMLWGTTMDGDAPPEAELLVDDARG